MKDLIKKILKEENDFQWAYEQAEGLEFYEKWLAKSNYYNGALLRFGGTPLRKITPNQAYDIVESIDYLMGDAMELLDYAEEVNDTSTSVKNRIDSLDTFESYLAMGTIVTNARLYLELISKFAEFSDIEEEIVVDMWEEIHGLKR